MVDELKRNGSGYYDQTAYKAMKKIEQGESEMKRGEIWEIGFGMEAKYAVVVSVQEKFCNTLVLSDEQFNEQDIAIKATGMRYTNLAMLSYAYKDRFNRFIRAMRDDELEDLIAAIAKKLDLPSDTELDVFEETVLAEKNEEIEALKTELEEAKTRILNMQTEPFVADIREFDEKIVLKTERDLYKKQYEMLLERLIGA